MTQTVSEHGTFICHLADSIFSGRFSLRTHVFVPGFLVCIVLEQKFHHSNIRYRRCHVHAGVALHIGGLCALPTIDAILQSVDIALSAGLHEVHPL